MLPNNQDRSDTNFHQLKMKFARQGLVQQIICSKQSESAKPNSLTLENPPILMPLFDAVTQNTTQFHDDYEVGQIVGMGANAIVKTCVRRTDKQIFAVKASEVQEEHLLYLRKLFNRLTVLSHPSLLHYRAMYINMKKRTCHIVMDYITHPNLSKFIYANHTERAPLTQHEIREIIRQLLEVIRVLHGCRLCHRDIKPDNILFDREHCRIWLIDFGVSKLLMEKNVPKVMMTNTGTCQYKAPEIYQGGIYTESVDLWAVGVVLYEIVERRLPFSKEYLSDTIQSIIDAEYQQTEEAWERISKHGRDLLHRLLRPAAKRLSAEEALRAPWFHEGPASRRSILAVSSAGNLSTPIEHREIEREHQLKQPAELQLLRSKTMLGDEQPAGQHSDKEPNLYMS